MILPAVLLIGVGWVGFPAINIQATNGIDDDEQGLAAGVLQTSMQVGAAVVLAVTTALIASEASEGPPRRRTRSTPTGTGWSSAPWSPSSAPPWRRAPSSRGAAPGTRNQLEPALPPEPEYAPTGG